MFVADARLMAQIKSVLVSLTARLLLQRAVATIRLMQWLHHRKLIPLDCKAAGRFC